MHDLTLTELAEFVGMTPRNIREWQTIGLLPAPERRGRRAHYSDAHVARIERIKSLRAEGFPLEVIRQFLDRSPDAAADVLHLTSAVLDPAHVGSQRRIGRAELRARLGRTAEAAVIRAGLVQIDGNDAIVNDFRSVECVEQLLAIGLPVDGVINGLDDILQKQIVGVRTLINVYRDEIWQPFVDEGLPATKFRAIADSSERMRELVIILASQLLRRATDTVIAEIAVAQAQNLSATSPK